MSVHIPVSCVTVGQSEGGVKDDYTERLDAIAGRGLDPVTGEVYDNGVRHAT